MLIEVPGRGSTKSVHALREPLVDVDHAAGTSSSGRSSRACRATASSGTPSAVSGTAISSPVPHSELSLLRVGVGDLPQLARKWSPSSDRSGEMVESWRRSAGRRRHPSPCPGCEKSCGPITSFCGGCDAFRRARQKPVSRLASAFGPQRQRLVEDRSRAARSSSSRSSADDAETGYSRCGRSRRVMFFAPLPSGETCQISKRS